MMPVMIQKNGSTAKIAGLMKYNFANHRSCTVVGLAVSAAASVAAFKRRSDCLSQRFAFEREQPRQRQQVVKILHAAVRLAKRDDRLELLGNHGLSG